MIRILNDDPRCLAPLQCNVRDLSLHEGICAQCRCVDRAQKALARFRQRRPKIRGIPTNYDERYAVLASKVGASCARKLIIEEAVRDRAREARAQ